MEGDLQEKLASIEKMAIPEKDRLFILGTLVELEIVLKDLREKERQLLEHQARLDEKIRERTRDLEVASGRLRQLASHDPLTGLRNRRMFFESIRDIKNQAERSGRGKLVLLLFIDIDNFKTINDTHGHLAGDTILKAAAELFRRSVRKTDYVFRYGGDEFTVILTNVSHRRDGEIVCRKILKNIDIPVRVNNVSIPLGASIGISVYPEDTADVEELIRMADKAMYRAKSGGTRYAYSRDSEQVPPS